MNKVNMHIHTIESDGIYNYEDIILMAKNMGLEIISITDHDNIDAVEKAIEYGENNDIFVIPGVELTANYPKGTCHILGYNIDLKTINSFTEYIKLQRIKKANKMIRVINSLGYNVTYDEVLKVCTNNVIGRRDIAKILVSKKYFVDEEAAINKLFDKGKPAYFETKSKSIEECISIIKRCGGIAIIAHPWTLNLNIEQLKQFLLIYGFDGIEVFNHNISNEQFYLLEKLADDLNLYKTCGTDFHGSKGFNELVVNKDVDSSKILSKIIKWR